MLDHTCNAYCGGDTHRCLIYAISWLHNALRDHLNTAARTIGLPYRVIHVADAVECPVRTPSTTGECLFPYLITFEIRYWTPDSPHH